MPEYYVFFNFVFHNPDTQDEMIYSLRCTEPSAQECLMDECDRLQTVFETLQAACKNIIPFTVYSSNYKEPKLLAEHFNTEEHKVTVTEVHFTDNVDFIIHLIRTEIAFCIDMRTPIPNMSIIRNKNHLVLNIYANGQTVYNVVANEHLMYNYVYNTIWRFGRLIYIDGIRMYNGCMQPHALAKYDDIAKTFYADTHRINTAMPSIPYE